MPPSSVSSCRIPGAISTAALMAWDCSRYGAGDGDCWASSFCSACRSAWTLASSAPYKVKLPAIRAASAAELSATILLSRAMICCWMVPLGVVVGVGVVPGLGDAVGEVDGDGDGDGVGVVVPPPLSNPGIGCVVLRSACSAVLNDVPCATPVWVPTITTCNWGN